MYYAANHPTPPLPTKNFLHTVSMFEMEALHTLLSHLGTSDWSPHLSLGGRLRGPTVELVHLPSPEHPPMAWQGG